MDSLLDDEKPELNITPLMDIMLVLMAILMVAAPTLVYEENINLPQSSKTTIISKVISIEIKIYKDKSILFQKQKYSYKDFINNFILQSNNLKKESTIYLKADENLKYKDVMYILKVIKESGFSKVSLVTKG